ncbi:uncharacterized protein LOC128254968 [Drosophila gunungcola]|uniref:uncharacterized protein LOC128254968 n=1 Tax=Drosophila gunungcola TaxID=103775 RepID=UPI0022E1E231|nr:uncharacterized protein LOC128254968 [Drosophila gunungcola]
MPNYGVFGGSYESEFIHNLTRQMIANNRIESMATFGVNRELQRIRFVVAKSIEQSLTEEFQLPIVVWGLRRNVTLRHLLGYKTLICVSITSALPDEEPIFDVLVDGLVGLHYVPMLFIYKRLGNKSPTQMQLNIFFAWCWQHRFTNVFITFQLFIYKEPSGNFSTNWHNQLYTYTPFPKLTVRNLTETGYQNVDILMDLRGYEFRVPFFQDPLNVFNLPNGCLSGAVGRLMAAFVHHRKGRLRLERVAHVDRYNYPEHLMLAAARGEVEMGVHPYSPMQPGSSLTSGSFPVGTTKTCILVPWQRESPAVRYMRMVARVNFPFFLILLLAMTFCWKLVCGQGQRGIQLTLVAFFQQSLPGIEFLRLAEAYKLIHVAIVLGSFILWSMRTANLSSVFTSQMPGSQIDTDRDFLATPLRLMLTETEVEMYFTAGRLPSALKPRLLVVNSTTLMEHLGSLNTSYAYCTTAEHWNVVKLQQRQMNSPFAGNFYSFGIFWQEFGFWAFWWRQSNREAISTGLVVHLTDDYQPGPPYAF